MQQLSNTAIKQCNNTTIKMKHILFTLICCCYAFNSFAQNNPKINITGTVLDSTSVTLVGATVVLKKQADETMAAFSITDNAGTFKLLGIEAGEYRLQITFVGYGSFERALPIKEGAENIDLGEIILSYASHALDAFTIESAFIPIIIKKDTVEYTADAFKTAPNAVVEDLLKKLPGIEVDKTGKIKAHGEEVKNVLVDGKEFFGGDTKLATKNLPADIVDKVQVYDKQSETAAFTGVEDGKEEKTINLALKEGKNKGTFGNIEGHYGTKNRYKAKTNINRFTKKMQLSTIGMANNINEVGFSFQDYLALNGGVGSLLKGNSMSFSPSEEERSLLGLGNKNGRNNAMSGGVNFNYELGKKWDWQSSYFINRVHTNTEELRNAQHFLNEQTYATATTAAADRVSNGHKLNTRLKYDIDASQNVLLKSQFFYTKQNQANSSNETSFNPEGVLQNTAAQNRQQIGNGLNWNGELIYRKKMLRPGRYFTTKLDVEQRSNHYNTHLNNYLEAQADSLEELFPSTTNQYQEQAVGGRRYELELVYVEPLGKRKYLSLEAAGMQRKQNQQKDFFDQTNAGTSIFNDDWSNQFQQLFSWQQLGASLKFNEEKYKLTLGLDFQHAQLKGKLLGEEMGIQRTYNRLLPRGTYKLDIDRSTNLKIDYATDLQAPSVRQLQPVVDNTNPLSIYQGNPNLQAAYNHHLGLDFRYYNQFNFSGFFASLNTDFTKNPIVNANQTDELLRTFRTPVNVDNEFRLFANASYHSPIRPLKIKINLSTNTNYLQGSFFVNGLEDRSQQLTNGASFKIANINKDVFDISLGTRINNNWISYQKNPALNQQYMDYTLFGDVAVYLKGNWILNVTVDYQRYSQEAFGQQPSITLLNAYVSKTVFKERGTVTITGSDLLNQNLGVERSSSYNITQERRTNVLGRYVLIGFAWKLRQFGV